MIRPFLTKKGCLENSDMMLINDDDMIADDKTLEKILMNTTLILLKV